jgi:HK97 family phage major capsid protein
MSDLATLKEEQRKLGHDIHELVKTPTADWSDELEGKFERMEADYQAKEKEIQLAERAEKYQMPEIPPGTEDHVSFEKLDGSEADRAKGGIVPDLAPDLTPTERELAFRGWALGRRATNPEISTACKRVGYDIQRDEIEFSVDRGVDKRGRKIRYPSLPPLSRQSGKMRPRTAGDIVSMYEARAIGYATPVGGPGVNTIPDEMMRPLEIALLQFGGMRQLSTIMQTATGANLPLPTTNDSSNKGSILAENTQVTEQDIEFQQIVFTAYKYTSELVRTSFEWLQDTSIDSAGVIGRLLGERIGRITNEHFTTGLGPGSSQPEGILVGATDSGITTTSNAVIAWEELLSLKHSVDPSYANSAGAAWMFNWGTLGILKKVKDQNDRPLWGPSLAEGEPATFDGDPYVVNQDMPAYAATQTPILFGDLTKYHVRDALGIQMLVLRERYADFAQVGWLAFSRHDGRLVDAGTNPIKYLNTPA